MSVQNTTGAAAAWAAWAAQQQARQAQSAGSGGIFAVPGESASDAAAAGSTKQAAAGHGLLDNIFGSSGGSVEGGTASGSNGSNQSADYDALSTAQQAGQTLLAHALASYAAQGALPDAAGGVAPTASLLA